MNGPRLIVSDGVAVRTERVAAPLMPCRDFFGFAFSNGTVMASHNGEIVPAIHAMTVLADCIKRMVEDEARLSHAISTPGSLK